MHCILVFDHLNDIVFSKCDKNFVKHIEKLGRKNGLTCPEPEVNIYVIFFLLVTVSDLN